MKILIFHTNHCVQCKELERRLEQFFKNSPECKEFVEWIDAEENEDDLAYYGIKVLPTVLCLDKSGALCERFNGYDPKYDYEKALCAWARHCNDIDANPQTHRGNPKYAH